MYIETTCEELLADTSAVTEINLNLYNLGLMYIETTCQELLADTSAVTEINLNRCVGKI